MSSALEVNDSNFDEEVLKAEAPVLVDFWAEWCGPCRMISPIVDKIAERYAERLKVVKVNVDDAQDIATRFGVMSIPNLKFFKGGEVVDEIVGAVPESTLAAKVDSLLG